jgi:hypothetical protein
MITLAEYNRRFDLIVGAFQTGHFSAAEASAAMHELTSLRIKKG